MKTSIAVWCLLVSATVVVGAQTSAPPAAVGAYVPQRVYDTKRAAFTDFEMMSSDLARADVVFIGEQHDDPNTHRLELAVLQGLARRNVTVTLSLEMFERDVQGSLDAYVSGPSSEDDFLKDSRPWPRYATDYRPLVEFARMHHWQIVAANVPRRIAAEVAKVGKAAIDSLSPIDRTLAAADLQCPRDAYYDRFAEQMGGHQSSSRPSTDANTERYYWAQCVKDETMAESIATASTRHDGRAGVVVHVTGSFHSDFSDGTPERARRRLAGRRVVVVSMIPVDNLDTVAPDAADMKRADYLVYTTK